MSLGIIVIIFLITALVLFLLAAFGTPQTTRVNLVALGLASATMAELIRTVSGG